MIETINSEIASDMRTFYLKVLDDLSNFEKRSVSVHHFGILSQDLINSLADGVEELMVSYGDTKKTIKRTFSILIEGLQNIRIHGAKDELERQIAFLFIGKNAKNYKIMMANIIDNSNQETLEKYLRHINRIEKEELKKLYFNILNDGHFSQKGGAGLGFLIMRMKSENPLEYSIFDLKDDKSLFVVTVTMERL